MLAIPQPRVIGAGLQTQGVSRVQHTEARITFELRLNVEDIPIPEQD